MRSLEFLVAEVRSITARVVAPALAILAASAVMVIVTPRMPGVWNFAWGIGNTVTGGGEERAWSAVWGIDDIVTGGVEKRQKRLVDHPFPAALAPPGYRLKRIEEIVDPDGEQLGVRISFAGPDYENSITYHPHGMTAPGVVRYWRRGDDAFGLKPVQVEHLADHSFCHEGDDVVNATHRVECVTAFDGLAIISDSANLKPAGGNLRHAIALLRAGVRHWQSIRS